MKKTLALLLALLMVTSCMVFTTAAEEAEETAIEIIPFATGADLEWGTVPGSVSKQQCLWEGDSGYWYWDGSRATRSYNAEEKAYQLTLSGVAANPGDIMFRYALMDRTGKKGSVDLSEMTHICFDMYISNVAAVSNGTFCFELHGRTRGGDAYEIGATKRLHEYRGGQLVNGWNHFEIDFTSFSNYDKYVEGGDIAEIYYFRLYSNGTGNSAGQMDADTVMMMRNIYFASEATVESPVIAPTDENYYLKHSYGSMTASYANATAYGAGARMNTSSAQPYAINLRNYDYLQMEVWIDDDALNNIAYSIEFSRATSADHGSEKELCMTLEQYSGTRLKAGEWTTIRIPLTKWLDNTKVNESFTEHNITWFRMFNSGIAATTLTGMTGYEGQTSFIVRINDIQFVRDACVTDPIVVKPIWTSDVVSGLNSKLVDGRTVTICDHNNNTPCKTYSASFSDMDGDGDNEWVFCNVSDSAPAYIDSNGSWASTGTTGKGIKSAINVGDSGLLTGFTGGDARAIGFEFKLYIECGGVDTDFPVAHQDALPGLTPYVTYIVGTDEGGAYTYTPAEEGQDLTGLKTVCFAPDDSILNQTFYAQISSTGSPTDAKQASTTLSKMFGSNCTYLREGEWCTVRLMFDNELMGTKDKVLNNNIDYFRIYNAAGFAFAGDLVMAIDDLSVIYDYSDTLTKDESETERITFEINDPYAQSDFTIFGQLGGRIALMDYFGAGSETSTNQTRRLVKFKQAYDATGGKEMASTIFSNSAKPDISLCFDFFVDVDIDDVTSERSKALLEAFNTKNWVLELASVPMELWSTTLKKNDVFEIATTQTLYDLVNLTKEDLLKGGWFHIEIPLSEFATSSNASYLAEFAAYNAEHGTSYDITKCDLSAITQMGMFYQTKTTNKELNDYAVFAIDNMYFKDTTPVETTMLKGATPTLNDTFNLDFRATPCAGVNADVIPVMEFTFGGKTTRVTATTNENGDYIMPFHKILAHCISDEISMKMYTVNETGSMICETKTYSIKDYCARMLAREDVAAVTKQLLSDALRYGAAAQTYASYNLDALATADVAGLLDAPAFDAASVTGVAKVLEGEYVSGAKWRSATLVLGSSMAIRYTFTADSIDGVSVNCSNGKTYTAFEAATDKDGADYYYFDVPVMADEFDETFTVSFAGAEGYKVNYSVNHYIATKYDASLIKTAALLAAIYNYGVAADAYVAALPAQ